MLYKLFKILNSNSFSFKGIVEGFKKGPKGIIKSIFLILFALYVFAVMIGMYTAYMIGTYKYLAANGNQQFMPLISMMVAVAVIMFFGRTFRRWRANWNTAWSSGASNLCTPTAATPATGVCWITSP